jgi:allantoin racemase
LIENLASVRAVDIPVLSLEDSGLLKDRLLEQAKTAVREDGAEAIVLGCTGMLGLAQSLMRQLKETGLPVPVVDPTAAAIGYLQLLIRAGLSQSKRAYPSPPEKKRSF